MIEGSGSVGTLYLMDQDQDPVGPKTYGSDGFGSADGLNSTASPILVGSGTSCGIHPPFRNMSICALIYKKLIKYRVKYRIVLTLKVQYGRVLSFKF